MLEKLLASVVPAHRPVDILTSDAGPGVGTSEKIVKLRSAEHFILHDLDLHCRMHFAPRDSKSHPVERVMASLNEALGDGRFITPHAPSLLDRYTQEAVFEMNPDDIAKAENRFQIEAAIGCAEKIAARYESTSCLTTSVHASVPSSIHDTPNALGACFFFDEEFMVSWHKATAANKKKMAGHHYYSFLEDFFAR
jgi:hypothetical protein